MDDKILELVKVTSRIEGKIDGIQKTLENHESVHSKLHARISNVKNQPNFFSQLVEKTRGLSVLAVFAYGVYSFLKEIGLK